MTYALGESLQMAIYGRLVADTALDALLSGAIYDAVPDAAPDLFVALGPEQAVTRSDHSGEGALHDMQISVVTKRGGYIAAKAAAARVSDALVGADSRADARPTGFLAVSAGAGPQG